MTDPAMSQASSPLIHNAGLKTPMVWRAGRILSVADFLADVHQLAQQLPDCRYVFNCCEDRYAFMVAFAAALTRGQTNLMPPSRAAEVIRDIATDYPDCCYLTDEAVEVEGIHCQQFQPDSAQSSSTENAVDVTSEEMPEIPLAHEAALVFTSGSTGRPKPNVKTWRSLIIGTQLAAERFFAGLQGQPQVLATVPPQHMYGLETTVLHALLSGALMHSGRPLFPDDVRASLQTLDAPRVLITTPIHLRALVKADMEFPSPAFVVSATAPLDAELASAAEALFQAPVLEIYGCTEAGSLASRRNLDGERWRLYPRMSIKVQGQTALLDGPQLDDSVPLADIIEQFDAQHFALRGRNADMLNIAGKRGSLADLNQRLLAIDGVEDGVIIQPDEGQGPVSRLAALVVAPGLSEDKILDALRKHTDAVFLPRPLYKVEKLPRNETGKLPRKAVLAMLAERGEKL
ncbi:MAG: AMP-binding protein [Salinisphaeraceae bacterium]|nr:AMP-binding protein [Salinisphaeraceae bacterium]